MMAIGMEWEGQASGKSEGEREIRGRVHRIAEGEISRHYGGFTELQDD